MTVSVEAGTQNAGWRPLGGLRGRLVLLTLAVLIPALLTASLLLLDAYRQQRRSLELQLGETARALSLVLERQVGQDRVLLQSLAASPALKDGDWAGFDAVAREASGRSGVWVVALDGEGQQRVNTALPLGANLPLTPLAGMTWSTPAEAPVRVSNMFPGPVVGRPITIQTMQVHQSDGGHLDLAVATKADSFARVWRDQRLPKGWTGAIIDGGGKIVARSRNPEYWVGRSASAAMLERIRTARAGIAETNTLDGIPSLTSWTIAPEIGWTVVLAVPRAELAAAARRSLLWGALIGLALLSAGVLLAVWVGEGIVRPVEHLADAARAWGRREPVMVKSSGLAETDELGAAFTESVTSLARREGELEQLNATLEARVEERTRELAEASESLLQAQKLEAVGRLTGGIAHDFNNLLMAVQGNLDLLRRRIDEPKLLDYVDRARQASERGAKLTAQLLAFSRRQRLEVRSVDVNKAVAAAERLLSSAIGGATRVDTVTDPELWPALADATQLELVILNLAINARDAMPVGGVITISTANVTTVARPDRSEAPQAGEFVRIRVADTGSGMGPEVLGRVFEPFFTTKGVGKGSGLGLPQVLGLAKQLGGGVEIDSTEGKGTEVRVFLPRASAAPRDEVRPVHVETPILAGAHILLVDDDVDVRRVAAALLLELGCQVLETSSGRAALEAFDQMGGFDAVVLDFAMPELNGGETAQRLRDRAATLPILMMSGFADLEALESVWTGPLLHKPFNSDQLAQALAGLVIAARA
jgi:signal transduction histidine kinase